MESNNPVYAHFARRFAAGVIDKMITTPVAAIAWYLMFQILIVIFESVVRSLINIGLIRGSMNEAHLYLFHLLSFVSFNIIAGFLYYSVMISSKFKGTVGNMILKTSVVNAEGTRVSYADAVIRYLYSFLSAVLLYTGYLMLIKSPRKQALHDAIADTYVVRRSQCHSQK